MLQDKVERLLDEGFKERPDLFLLDLKVSSAGDIKVIIDGDHQVSVEDCIFLSRAVEHHLDRDEEDFSIEVTSSGVGRPLQHPRQFMKNKGRKLQVTDDQGKTETGTLTHVDDTGVSIEWKAREPKPIGKGKHTVKKELHIPYENIKEAIVQVTF